MAWEYHERYDRRTASTDDRAGQTISRFWELFTDDPFAGPQDAIAALALLTVPPYLPPPTSLGGDSLFPTTPPLPSALTSGVVLGSIHPTYPAARCTKISAAGDDEHPLRYFVTAEYQEPRDEIEVSGTFRRVDRFDTTDLDGTLIQTTAEDLFDDALPMPKTEGVIQVRRRYDAVSYFQLESYLNKTNSAPVLGFDTHTLLVTGCNYRHVPDRGRDTWVVDWELTHRPLSGEYIEHQDPDTGIMYSHGDLGGWRWTAVLNVGWSAFVDADGDGEPDLTDDDKRVKRPVCYDTGENLLTKPAKLGLNGVVLPQGAEPVYRLFRLADAIAFDLIVS